MNAFRYSGTGVPSGSCDGIPVLLSTNGVISDEILGESSAGIIDETSRGINVSTGGLTPG